MNAKNQLRKLDSTPKLSPRNYFKWPAISFCWIFFFAFSVSNSEYYYMYSNIPRITRKFIDPCSHYFSKLLLRKQPTVSAIRDSQLQAYTYIIYFHIYNVGSKKKKIKWQFNYTFVPLRCWCNLQLSIWIREEEKNHNKSRKEIKTTILMHLHLLK